MSSAAVPVGRLRTRAAIARLLPPELTTQPFSLTDLFARELDEYAEIIVAPGRRAAGFMTRGEDASFTERARLTLTQLGMPPEAVAHHRALAGWFEHVRAFLKVEWHRTEEGAEPLAACYFRRRPEVDDVLARLARFGVTAPARELVMDVAQLLDKDTVHFVSAAFRPGSEVHHKLYFSQWVTPETRDAVTERIARVLQLFGFSEEAEAHFRINHRRMVSREDSTLFVSVSFTKDAIAPSIKIDYPAVAPARAAAWLPEAEQLDVLDEAQAACELAGTRAVSYLGVRLGLDWDAPSLKYYCDVPAPPPPTVAP